MGRDALEKAIDYYRGEPDKQKEGNIVCECFGVTDIEIKRSIIENNLSSVEVITDYVKAGGGCGKCHDKIQEIIDSVQGGKEPGRKKPANLTNIQKIRLIEDVFDKEIRPALQKDGGDIELIDLDADDVIVKMRGACANCATSQVTLKDFIETKLRELVSPELIVKEVPL